MNAVSQTPKEVNIAAAAEPYRNQVFVLILCMFLGSLVGNALLASLPDVPVRTFLVQFTLTCLLGFAAVLLVARPNRSLLGIVRLLAYGLCLIFVLKFVDGVYGDWQGRPAASSLPPFAGWLPVPIILAYLCLPDARALRLALAYSGTLMVILGVLVGLRWEVFVASLPLKSLALQLLLAHPLIIGLMYLMGDFIRVLSLQVAEVESERDQWIDDLGIDTATGLLNRTGLTLQLIDQLQLERQPRIELVVLATDISLGGQVAMGGEQLDEQAEEIAAALRAALPPEALASRVAGLGFCWLRPADEEDLSILIGEMLGPLVGTHGKLRVGAARFHTGETIDAWIARAGFTAFAAEGDAPLIFARNL